jgi:hypothetical protein
MKAWSRGLLDRQRMGVNCFREQTQEDRNQGKPIPQPNRQRGASLRCVGWFAVHYTSVGRDVILKRLKRVGKDEVPGCPYPE